MRHQQRQAKSAFVSLGFSREIGSQTKVRCSLEMITSVSENKFLKNAAKETKHLKTFDQA